MGFGEKGGGFVAGLGEEHKAPTEGGTDVDPRYRQRKEKFKTVDDVTESLWGQGIDDPEMALMKKRGEISEEDELPENLQMMGNKENVSEQEENEDGEEIVASTEVASQELEDKKIEEFLKSRMGMKQGPQVSRVSRSQRSDVIIGHRPAKMPLGKKQKGAPTIREEKAA